MSTIAKRVAALEELSDILSGEIDELRNERATAASVPISWYGKFSVRCTPEGTALVYFKYKPSEAILNALRIARFSWDGMRWTGRQADLPRFVVTQHGVSLA